MQDRRQEAEEREEALARRWPWLLPLAAGIFLGAPIFEMLPEALDDAGPQAWLWTLAGLVIFVLVRDGLDHVGRHGASLGRHARNLDPFVPRRSGHCHQLWDQPPRGFTGVRRDDPPPHPRGWGGNRPSDSGGVIAPPGVDP